MEKYEVAVTNGMNESFCSDRNNEMNELPVIASNNN